MSRSKLRNKWMQKRYKGFRRYIAISDKKDIDRNPHRLDEVPKNRASRYITSHCSADVEWLQESTSFGGHSIPKGGHRRVSGLVRANVKEEIRKEIESELHDKYDEIKIYEGGRLDYYLARKNGKFGILDAKGNEIAPVIMDKVHEMIDTDGCIPLVKDGKWGLVHLGMYVEPIYDKMEIRSEAYVKVWLNGVQGWLDINGQFTTEKSQADIGSWYDVDK